SAGVKWWDLAAGTELQTVAAPGKVTAVAFSPAGKHLAAAWPDGTIRLLDVATGKETASLAGHAVTAQGLAFTPDGVTLVSGGGLELRLWDVASLRGPRPEGLVAGIVIDKKDNSMTVKADGEEEPVTYVLGDHPDPATVQAWKMVFN